MIGPSEVETYRREGYLILPDILTAEEVENLRRVTDEFVERSRAVSTHSEMFDLEDGHTP
jgi:phytanoyl-CoA hydroxylase